MTLPVTANASREENDVDQTLVATLNSVLGGNRLNTLRVNFTQEDVSFANANFNGNGQDQAALMPQLNYLTFVDQQNAVAQARVNDAYQIDDTMSWFITGRGGSHDLKFGGQYEYVGAQSTAQDNANGTFWFRSDLLQRRRSPHLPRAAADSRPGRAEPLSEGPFRVGVRAGQVARDEPRDAEPRVALRRRDPADLRNWTIPSSPIRRPIRWTRTTSRRGSA